jgi:asparagine synthase (glutamine-hydrolysing)
VCGICGLVTKGDHRVTSALLEHMRDTMAHRGPDDAGEIVLDDGRVGLGHRRLSIVDLSPAGHQPMSNEDGTVWISYNGEVYNHTGIRSQLETKGHAFRSCSDTEALVHLYEERGADMVHELRGMFAFAIWDNNCKTLLLVRDRLGIKPLYYADTPNGLVFASEIKALFASGMLRPSMDASRLPEYLNYGRVLPPHTLFQGVSKLEPGHVLQYGPDGVARVSCYWDLFDGVDRIGPGTWSDEELVAQLRGCLGESVRMRLMSDVPVGVFLSAGVDSSTIAALVAQSEEVPLKTFTVGFEGTSVHNEVDEARSIARLLGADHHDITVRASDAKCFFPVYLDFMEEPGSNPIWMAIYFVSRLARENGVIVALSGDGGDELFVGYDKWMKMLRLHRYGWNQFAQMPGSVRRALASAGKPLVRGRVGGDMLRAAAAGEELFQGGTAFKRDEVTRLVRADLLEGMAGHSAYGPVAELRRRFERCAPDAHDYADWMSYMSLKSGLLEDYLMRVDKMGMAASVEGRVPLLDHEFVRLAMSIRGSRKYAGWQRKRLMKDIARQLLPSELVDAPKRGFNAPVEAWITGDFADMLSDGVSSLADHTGILTSAGARRLKQDLRTGAAGAAGCWGMMSLALWYGHWVARG